MDVSAPAFGSKSTLFRAFFRRALTVVSLTVKKIKTSLLLQPVGPTLIEFIPKENYYAKQQFLVMWYPGKLTYEAVSFFHLFLKLNFLLVEQRRIVEVLQKDFCTKNYSYTVF